MNMSDDSGEYISRLVDGELEDPILPGLLDKLERDPGLRRRWAHYHLISDTLRNHLADVVDPALAERVREALEAEATILAPRLGWRFGTKELLGLAMAASITTIAVLGVYRLSEKSELAAPPVASLAQAPSVVTSASAPHAGETPVTYARLYNYLLDHSAHASVAGMPGLLPYVRVVGHSTR